MDISSYYCYCSHKLCSPANSGIIIHAGGEIKTKIQKSVAAAVCDRSQCVFVACRGRADSDIWWIMCPR